MSEPQATGGAAILARLRARRSQAGIAPKAVTILYGSQTGTAEDIATGLHADCGDKGIKAKVSSCNEHGFGNVSVESTPIVVFVVSSTGEGDPPDNARKFFEDMTKHQSSDKWKGIHWTLLGLGDSNFATFMNVPRMFQKKCHELGANMFYEYKEADEMDDIDDIAEAWVEGLWEPLKKVTMQSSDSKSTGGPKPGALPDSTGHQDPDILKSKSSVIPETLKDLCLGNEKVEGVPALPQCHAVVSWEGDQEKAADVISDEARGPMDADLMHRSATGTYTQQQPFWAEVSDARLMTAAWSDRRVIHVELDLQDSNIHYAPGDSIGVAPENSPEMVAMISKRIGLEQNQVFSISPTQGSSEQSILPRVKSPCSVQHALTFGCDLTSPPRKLLLRYLAEKCSEESDGSKLLYLCSRTGRDAYKACILDAQLSLADILECFPSCQPALDGLLDLLPPLAPRMYSATSSLGVHPGKVQFAFTVAKVKTPMSHRLGVATGWMNRIMEPMISQSTRVPKLPIFAKTGGAFRPPEDLSKNWVLIGPGTGVAPFRGFLEERRLRLKEYDGPTGECWLFFGCRREDEDYLYRDDLQDFLGDGILSCLEVAFSREQDHKVYVQHKMKPHGKSLHGMLFQQKGYVFVCGDGQHMARDVHGCLSEILQEYGGLSEEAAEVELKEMAEERTYVRDVWS